MDRNRLQNTIFQRIAAIFIRTRSGHLVHCLGPFQVVVESSWGVLQRQLHETPSEDLTQVHLESSQGIATTVIHLTVFEIFAGSGDEIIGILLQPGEAKDPEGTLDLFFCALILKSIHLDPQYGDDNRPRSERQLECICNAIVDHFDQTLRYSSLYDEWETLGREYFLNRIQHFVNKGQRIEFCLPAFPCKSSNLNKVQGVQPDRGEFIALTNLNQFIQGIEKLYPPGAKLWIISDGHVFSDCIGVDDAVVDAYGAELVQMSESITQSHGSRDRIGFKSLVDIFALKQSRDWLSRTSLAGQIPQIAHHILTKLDSESELCRRILMMGFQADSGDLRQRIESQEASILALYRGFSRFMLEDLDENIYTRGMSRTQRRKLSSKVAFEMIQRNQAYSNLVEILFPHHVRLSIHAHSNAGPKFGIQMFGPGVRATNLLSADGSLMESSDLLHIPTPWHNCVVEIQGHKTLYVTKSGVAKSALANGELRGGPHGAFHDEGEFFKLEALPSLDDKTGSSLKKEDQVSEENPDPIQIDGKSRGNKAMKKERGRDPARPSLAKNLRRVLAPFWSCVRLTDEKR